VPSVPNPHAAAWSSSSTATSWQAGWLEKIRFPTARHPRRTCRDGHGLAIQTPLVACGGEASGAFDGGDGLKPPVFRTAIAGFRRMTSFRQPEGAIASVVNE